jgi:hypothetical protein
MAPHIMARHTREVCGRVLQNVWWVIINLGEAHTRGVWASFAKCVVGHYKSWRSHQGILQNKTRLWSTVLCTWISLTGRTNLAVDIAATLIGTAVRWNLVERSADPSFTRASVVVRAKRLVGIDSLWGRDVFDHTNELLNAVE